MRKYEQMVKIIINNVGGKKNITSATHCLTRVRFNLRNFDLVNEANILNCDGVLTAQKSGGEYQVVVGAIVNDVFEEVSLQLGLDQQPLQEEEAEKEEGSLLMRAIKTMTKCITPILGVMSATGFMQGIFAILVNLGILVPGTGEHTIVMVMANTVLKFLPVFIGFTAAKTFRMKNEYIGLLIGLAMVFPDLEATLIGASETPLYTLFGNTMFATDIYSTFFGIPIMFPSGGYYSTLIPVMVAVWFASKVEKWATKHVSELIAFAIVPMITIFVAYPCTLLVLGPISNFAGLAIQNAILFLYDLSPVIASAFICIIYQPMVVLGLHWPLAPIQLNNLATLGYDPVLACMWPSAFSLAGVAAAVWLRTKDRRMKNIAAPACISALFHIMEPALYGLTVPNKKYFKFAVTGATLGGVFLAAMGVKNYGLTGSIFGVVGFINPENGDMFGMWMMIIAELIVIGVPFLLTFFTYKEDNPVQVQSKKSQVERVMVNSPVEGTVVLLPHADDEIFKSETLGKGIAVNPTSGDVYAPFDGTMTNVFPTKHAYGLTSDDGIEVMIHIGIDTVKLDGKYFEAYVNQGDRVKAGQRIAHFDLEGLKREGYNPQTYVVISNTDDYLDILESVDEHEVVKSNQPFLYVLFHKQTDPVLETAHA